MEAELSQSNAAIVFGRRSVLVTVQNVRNVGGAEAAGPSQSFTEYAQLCT